MPTPPLIFKTCCHFTFEVIKETEKACDASGSECLHEFKEQFWQEK